MGDWLMSTAPRPSGRRRSSPCRRRAPGRTSCPARRRRSRPVLHPVRARWAWSRRSDRRRCRPAGGDPSPIRSPLKSIGALSFSPSPMTTIPSMATVWSTTRMAFTAAPSAPSLSPRPIHRLAAMAAASVTRTSSMARLRSGACSWRSTGQTLRRPSAAQALARAPAAPVGCPGRGSSPGTPPPGRHTWAVDRFVIEPDGPLAGTVRAGGAKNSVLKLMAACLLAEGRHRLANVPRIVDVEIMTEVLQALGADVARRRRRGAGHRRAVDRGPAPRGALRAGGAHAGLHRGARTAARPLRRGPGLDARWRRLRQPADRHPPERPRARWARTSRPPTATSRAGWPAPGRRRVSWAAGWCSSTRATPPPTTSSWRPSWPRARP